MDRCGKGAADALSRYCRRSATASRSFSSSKGSYACDLRDEATRVVREFMFRLRRATKHTTRITTTQSVTHSGNMRKSCGARTGSKNEDERKVLPQGMNWN